MDWGVLDGGLVLSFRLVSFVFCPLCSVSSAKRMGVRRCVCIVVWKPLEVCIRNGRERLRERGRGGSGGVLRKHSLGFFFFLFLAPWLLYVNVYSWLPSHSLHTSVSLFFPGLP